MPSAPNEQIRVAAVCAYDLLNTAEEEIFTAISRAAAEVCHTPMAALSFVGHERQWFTNSVGLSNRETRRDVAFCANTINGKELFVVQDASRDVRFRDNPTVVGEPYVRFYAGMPLIASGGLSLGVLCVLDTVPRPGLNDEQRRTLSALAANAIRVLHLRRNTGSAVYAKAVDMASDGVTISTVSAEGPTILYANESFLRFSGYQYYEAIGQPCIFPSTTGCPSVTRSFEEACIRGQLTTAECQIRKKSGYKAWDRISFVPYVNEQCKVVYVVAVHRDISYQKEAEMQAQQLHAMRTTLATVDHVVKNFMNAAKLYSLQASSGKNIDLKTQQAFDVALHNTRVQLAAMHGMPAFKDRPTPFGISLLDHEERN